ncbi:MAG: squalene synthase HpnC [Bryobacteraceae bacterium]
MTVRAGGPPVPAAENTRARHTPVPVFLAPKDYVRSKAALVEHYSPVAAEAYTRWLATHHYENFHVVSFLLPKRLHQDFYNVYSYCRWADDLGDELGDTQESLRLLGWWREQLEAMYSGEADHPVFIALRGTVARHSIPQQPFADLITAFEQDQVVRRYRTWEDLFGYCRNSANPVGRLVLYLCGYSDAERQRLSDATCTALQLANFWQDVTVDLEKDRVYIPLEIMERHGYGLEDLFARRATPAFIEVMREICSRARELFEEGLPLVSMLDRRLALDIDLFSRGGMRVLDKIAQQGYDVLARRPAIGKVERVRLLLASLARVAFSRAA